MWIKDLIKDLDSDISQYLRTVEANKKVQAFLMKYPELDNIDQNAHTCIGRIYITVKSMDELHEVRQRLINALPHYTDERTVTFHSTDMHTEFECPTHPVTIRLSTPPEEFPKELQSERCKVVRLPDHKAIRYSFVCTKEGEGEKQ